MNSGGFNYQVARTEQEGKERIHLKKNQKKEGGKKKELLYLNSRSTHGRFRLLALTLRVAVFLAGNVESN